MPKKFDDYLSEEAFSKRDREALDQIKSVEDISKEKSPIDTKSGFTPDPRDAGKQSPEEQEQTVEEAGETLHDHGVKSEDNPMQKYEDEPTFQPDKELLERHGIDLEFNRDDC